MFDFHISQYMHYCVVVIDCVQAVVLLLERQGLFFCDVTQDFILPLGTWYPTLKGRVCSTLSGQRMLLGRKLQYNNSKEGAVA